MGIGEVSSINKNNGYVGQGSSTKSAPQASAPVKNDSKMDSFDAAVVEVSTDSAAEVTNKDEIETDSTKKGASASLRDAVSKINAASANCEAVFGIHDETNRVMIKMVDKETKEVVKEFPAEETLDLIAKAWELAGIMVDEKG